MHPAVEAFERWWVDTYQSKFSDQPGVMQEAWKEVARVAFIAGWYRRMERIQLVCTNSGHYVKGQGIQGIEITARLYDHKGLYFEGRGRTDAEAIGVLVCRCPEKFNTRFDIREDFELQETCPPASMGSLAEPHQNRR